MKLIVIAVAALALAAPASAVLPPEAAVVTRVVDGDTLRIRFFDTNPNDYLDLSRDDHGTRIVGIDTPERGECGYLLAKEALDSLVTGRIALRQPDYRFDKDGIDRYGRLLRYVSDNHRDVGYNLVRYGFAESFRRYPHDRLARYNAAEARAKSEKRGLWRECGHP